MTCALIICLFHQEMIAKEAGGLSGRPLLEMSTQLLSDMYRLTDGTPPLLHHHRVEAEG
jgi:dihydroorotate dehydrogenase